MKTSSFFAGFALVAASLLAIPADSAAQSGPEDGQRVVLITGSTGGLGAEVARRVGAAGAHVIVHGRDEERGAEVVRAIESSGGTARFYRADLASFEDTRAFGEAILADYDRIDVLVNNAGFGSAPNERWVTDDGHEFRFQVNYLSHFLLTEMWKPLLVANTPSRLVNVSSLAQSPIDFDDVMIENNFSGGRAYGQSKLAQILHAFDLHEELGPRGVLVTVLHPATYMDTGMVRRAGVTPRASVDEGADAVMQLVDDDVEGGQFFRGLVPMRANDQAYDLDARARLKALSEEITGTGN